MNLLRNYITRNITMRFFSIFIPLFIVASVVFLVRVSIITSIIEIDFYEMLELYLLILPDLLFYTLPPAFFIGGVTTFSKLSFDSEMVVIFSAGVSPQFLLKLLLKLALIFSTLLLFISIVVIPHARQMSEEFIILKKQDAVLNIHASGFGENFGNWSIFIDSIDELKKERLYRDVALFYVDRESGEERFIVAKSASIKKNRGVMQLLLRNGSLFSYRIDNMSQIYFEEMRINSLSSINLKPYRDTVEFFQHSLEHGTKRIRMITNIILSLFPVLSIFMILSIGIQNLRYGKGAVNLYMGISIGIYYFLAFYFSEAMDFWTIGVVLPIWFFATYYIYRERILSKF
jgi:lipopolysaccharide export system permease protein